MLEPHRYCHRYHPRQGLVVNVSATELHAMLRDGDELALVDAREEAPFGARHILLAVNLPLSLLELRVANLVPRRSRGWWCATPRGDGLARRGRGAPGAARLHPASTCSAVGPQAWEDAGFEVFSGVNVPSKLFGEFVEHHYDTPVGQRRGAQAPASTPARTWWSWTAGR